MGVCGCVIPNPNCHCHFTPVSDWQYNNLKNHLITMPKSILDQIGKEHTEEIERLRQHNERFGKALQKIAVSGSDEGAWIIAYKAIMETMWGE